MPIYDECCPHIRVVSAQIHGADGRCRIRWVVLGDRCQGYLTLIVTDMNRRVRIAQWLADKARALLPHLLGPSPFLGTQETRDAYEN